jgi:hypothetical protein
MVLLSPTEIADLWATWAEGLIDVCRVSARVEVTHPARGAVLGWPAVTQTIPCAQLSQGAAIAAGFLPDETTGTETNVLTVKRDVTIHAGDRVEINGNGIAWNVEGEPKRPGTYDPGVFINCSRAAT